MKKKKTVKKASGKKPVRKVLKKTVKKTAAKNKPSNHDDKKFRLTPSDIDKIAHSLGVEKQSFGNHYRLYLENPAEARKLTLEIYPDIPIGTRQGSLITVYTTNAHLQLQFCSGYVISEMLGEVTFVGMHDGKLSGLIIEKGAACSFYANVDTELLSGDITQLGPEVMLSGIALSLTESIINK
ncbi:hypothetical protein K1X84_12825 [bacterium]|nr:hypothetical protein [bacterium]